MVKMLLAALLSACTYTARYNDCEVRCATDATCPEGLACGGEGLCREPGMTAACSAILGDADIDASPVCADLPATCGSTGTSSCCESPLVTGGTFYRSYDVSGDGMYSSTSYPATVSDFRFDRFEVTVGRFRQFVLAHQGTQANPPSAGAGSHTLIPSSGWDSSWNGELTTDTAALVAAVKCQASYQTWTDAAGANENLPMNCVTWFEAAAFCAWDGGYLPTDAEWNYAATGGSEQRAYPWSSPPNSLTIDCSYANYYVNPTGGTYCASATGGLTNRVGNESPRGDGRWGQSDVEGNVFEWALDWYANPYPTMTCDDCANLTPAALRVIRGGGFNADANTLRTGRHLVVDPPTTRFINVGFRCARAP
jgi:sulfatase modifying factor 1